MDLFEKMALHHARKLPFVVYRKPGSDSTIGVFQQDDSLNELVDFTESGFAFASFDGDSKYYIPAEKADVYLEKAVSDFYPFPTVTEPHTDQNAKTNFKALVESGVAAIRNGDFEKVVLSRAERQRHTGLDPVGVTKALQFYYPSAFTYCFFHPKIGLWMGATPEQLLKADGLKVATVALAGTQLYAESSRWGSKEKQEQQFVTDFICLSMEGHCSNIKISEPYTVQAGNLAHIKTDISADLNRAEDFGKLVRQLHPTPAVCGLPKKPAKKFILEHEGYDRQFYTGFLGELNIDFKTFSKAKSDLFVNLRCMELKDETAIIYVGCGVTKDSIPEKEFIETQNKTLTMRKVVNL